MGILKSGTTISLHVNFWYDTMSSYMANIELFKKMIQESDYMCEELKELLAPEIVEFKIRLAEQNAQLAE